MDKGTSVEMARARDQPTREQLRLVIVGHVDHGKSTLIGRLLYETDSLPPEKLDEIRQISSKRGMPLEWSFLLDSFQAERDQAITIDTTRIWLRLQHRDVVIIDAPGHHEFLKNMISGAADADAAILIVDALDGVQEQTRRHAYLLRLLGIRQLLVAVNKIDLIEPSKPTFTALKAELLTYLGDLGLSPKAIIPISAREGDNLTERSFRTPYYEGPPLLDWLGTLRSQPPSRSQPLRFIVQDVYKFDDRRIVIGRVAAGQLRVGDNLMFLPGERIARVHRIESWGPNSLIDSAGPGAAIGIVLDQPIFVERGQVASRFDNLPALADSFRGKLFWLSSKPLVSGAQLRLKIAMADAPVTVESIERIVDLATLAEHEAGSVERNGFGKVIFRSPRTLAVADYRDEPMLGRFVLLDGFTIVGGGVVDLEGFPDRRLGRGTKATNITPVSHLVSRAERAMRNRHGGAILWFTGLSGAGKSTLALRLERHLFDRGVQCYVLDGDNLRSGLNSDLGFSPEDRVENIRRAGEVAALFADAGVIVIVALISPFAIERQHARRAAGQVPFSEVYIKASLETCEKRDMKGLYSRARLGTIPSFTGVSAPYETPQTPDLIIDTEHQPIEQSVDQLLAHVIGLTTIVP